MNPSTQAVSASLPGIPHGKEALAAINATLNGTSALLIVIGYVLIRRSNWRVHAYFMSAALVTSATFLCTYLYSQYAFGDRSSHLSAGPLRTTYLVLLASHVLLAVGMLPPIGITVWNAYRRKWDSHRQTGKPSFWIWLYVSVTGVIVYWMLYHLFPSMNR